MTMKEIWDTLKKQGCVSLYRTGSSINPYIKNPRDEEYYAIFNTSEEAYAADNIYQVFKIAKGEALKQKYWSYLYHYLNNAEHLGEDYVFDEPDLEITERQINYVKNNIKLGGKSKKLGYHFAMLDAIKQYGYDNIPEDVAQYINDIHDLKVEYPQNIKYK